MEGLPGRAEVDVPLDTYVGEGKRPNWAHLAHFKIFLFNYFMLLSDWPGTPMVPGLSHGSCLAGF